MIRCSSIEQITCAKTTTLSWGRDSVGVIALIAFIAPAHKSRLHQLAGGFDLQPPAAMGEQLEVLETLPTACALISE